MNEAWMMKILSVFGGLLFIFLLWMWWLFENRSIVVTKYEFSNANRERENCLSGFKIVQISDLHNTNFGKHQNKLISSIIAQKPDFIFITGDIVDRHDDENLEKIEDLLKGIDRLPQNKNFDIKDSDGENFDMGCDFVQVFYVTGNHEITYRHYEVLETLLRKYHVRILHNESMDFEVRSRGASARMRIIGLRDWGFQPKNNDLKGEKWHEFVDEGVYKILKDLKSNSPGAWNIVLSHRPEKFSVYVRAGVDLVFTGHAHGGQIRLPFFGSILAPHQGFFPKYTQGMHEKSGEGGTVTSMIVSRGLGGTKKFPTRWNNRPELVVLEFK